MLEVLFPPRWGHSSLINLSNYKKKIRKVSTILWYKLKLSVYVILSWKHFLALTLSVVESIKNASTRSNVSYYSYDLGVERRACLLELRTWRKADSGCPLHESALVEWILSDLLLPFSSRLQKITHLLVLHMYQGREEGRRLRCQPCPMFIRAVKPFANSQHYNKMSFHLVRKVSWEL